MLEITTKYLKDKQNKLASSRSYFSVHNNISYLKQTIFRSEPQVL